jgi:hypothetical protein
MAGTNAGEYYCITCKHGYYGKVYNGSAGLGFIK